MKIAIHERSGSFSDRWIEHCKKNKIPFKLVNAYDNDIINQIQDCSHFIWHFFHNDYRDMLFAKELIKSIELKNIKVFPNSDTCWFFDDKVGQKYLLESVQAPLVKTYVFYNKFDAIRWIKSVDFPKIFKLRVGAGSLNVFMVKTKKHAIRLVKKAFSKGFPIHSRDLLLKERIWHFKRDKNIKSFFKLIKGLIEFVKPLNFNQKSKIEKGYAYFQDFIPNNLFDLRVIVVGDRAFAAKRFVRKGDFRASGSGFKEYPNQNNIDKRCLKIAFSLNKLINAQSIAYDFVFDNNNNPLIVEVSYGFSVPFYDPCPGYWDKNMSWFKGKFIPQNWMIDDLISNN